MGPNFEKYAQSLSHTDFGEEMDTNLTSGW